MADKLTIVVNDSVVFLNGKPKLMDLRALLQRGIRAVQWDGEQGHIEFFNNPYSPPGSQVRPPEALKNIEEFAPYIIAWRAIPEPEPPKPVEIPNASVPTAEE